jgi:dolichol-phosphate mannosyltransferase
MISIILPTYNEKDNIPIIVDKIAAVFHAARLSFEIIVADDNSPDETWKIARALAVERPWLRVLRRLADKGLGPAVMDGFHAAQGDWMVVMDADMQHDELVLPKFVELFQNGADIVVGTRHGDGGSVGEWNAFRKFVSFSAALMARLSLGKTTSDPMSGFFGVSKKFFAEVEPDINPRGFKILLEFLSRSGSEHALKEVGYTFKTRQFGESKLSSKIIFEYLVSLYELSPIGRFVSFRMLRYGVVGLTGVLVNFACSLFLLKLLMFSDKLAVMSAIAVSIFSNYALNNVYTFSDHKKKTVAAFVFGLLSYYIICSVGAFVQYSVFFTLSKDFAIPFYFANGVGIILATFWNFMLSATITWKAKN